MSVLFWPEKKKKNKQFNQKQNPPDDPAMRQTFDDENENACVEKVSFAQNKR